MGEPNVTVKETRDGKWSWHVRYGGKSAKGISSTQSRAHSAAEDAVRKIERQLRKQQATIRKVKRMEQW